MMAGQNGKRRPSNHDKDAVENNMTTKETLHRGWFWFAMVDVLFVILLICCIVYLIPQLLIIGKSSIIIQRAGEMLLAVCIQIIAIIKWNKKKETIQTKESIFINIVRWVFVNCLLLFSLVLMTVSVLVEDQEEHPTSSDIQVLENLGKPIVDMEQILIKKETYYFEGDPYVSSEKIDGYRGVQKGKTEQEGSEIEAAAEVIYINIFDVFHPQTDTEESFIDYENKTATANAYHEEYKKWYNNPPDGSDSEVAQFMCQGRIDILEQAIACRMKADKSYKDAENRRMVAVHYIEEGDEYQAAGNMEMAEKCYEQSAIWGMKALYLAVPGTNITKMEDCLDIIKIASERMTKMNGSKSYELSRAVAIYTEVVKRRIAELQT